MDRWSKSCADTACDGLATATPQCHWLLHTLQSSGTGTSVYWDVSKLASTTWWTGSDLGMDAP